MRAEGNSRKRGAVLMWRRGWRCFCHTTVQVEDNVRLLDVNTKAPETHMEFCACSYELETVRQRGRV